MKLVTAKFKNFRLLKDLSLDFSTSTEKPLTVIRAANETGKTTCENALIWGLYGSNALPGKGKKYQLFPSDEISTEGIEVSVEIEFETEQVISLGKGKQEFKNVKYRLLRTCLEHKISGKNFQRESEKILLYEVTDKGVQSVIQSDVKAIIENSIPEALKDVYFTDGDSAMTFIEAAATQGIKRKRVRDAVEALLGLKVLESTIKDVNKVAAKFSQKIDDTDYSEKLKKINDKIEFWEEDIETWNDELHECKSRISEGEKKLIKIEKEIENF